MKNTFKQKFAFLLALTMLLSTLPTTALAADTDTTPEEQTSVIQTTTLGVGDTTEQTDQEVSSAQNLIDD